MKNRRRKKADSVKEEPFTVVEIEDFETVCHVCDAEFIDGEDLKVHVAQVHLKEPSGKPICKACRTVLPGAEAFVSHFIFKHLENSSFCFYCYRAFENSLLLDQHELKHCAVADDSALTCSQCSNIFINRQQLQTHEYQEHVNSEDGFMLNSIFSLLSSMLNMKIRKFLDCLCKKNPLSCRKCNYSSLRVKDYIDHLRTFKCQSFSCDKCFNVYKKKHGIMNHVLNKPQCHNYISKNDIQQLCSKCDQFFDSKDISDHEKSCNIIKCSACKKLFNSIYELTDHRINEHQVSIKLKTCKFCKKQFVGTSSLKKHMKRSHKNKNLYKYNCTYCGSIFAHPSKLFAHFFTNHKDINPFTCKICNECFRLRKNFTIHIKLQHKSIGFVEFDKNLHVIFTDKKSENPVEPQAHMNIDSTTDCSDSDSNDISQEKTLLKQNAEAPECKGNENDSRMLEGSNFLDVTPLITTSPDKEIDSDLTRSIDTNDIKIECVDTSPKIRQKRKQKIVRSQQKKREAANSPEQISDHSEEEPLSNVRESLLREKIQNSTNLRRRMTIRDKKAKLTCKICNKYCYTVQNYHHHLTLHEKTKLKRCIKCQEYFQSRTELKHHMKTNHSSSKLTETLKSVLEKRKKIQPTQTASVRPGESLKSLLEKRKRQQMITAQNSTSNKFRRTIRKVNVVDDCTATITPISDHGLSVKNFIENFRPEADSVSISNSVTIKAVNAPVDKAPSIKMHKFNPELPPESCRKLSFPVRYKDPPLDYMDSKVNVKLVQQLITKPKLVNMSVNEQIPVMQERNESEEYCNMFADETDYSQYKNTAIPEVAHEVMLGDPEDIPRTRRLAQEIIIPKIPDEYGGVRIGHLLPQAPYYKIVKVKKLLKAANDPETEAVPEDRDKDVKLPDGTRLISVKNPYAHLIPNEHLEEVLKANRTKYYTPKTKNIEKAIAKALNQIKPPRERKGRKKTKKDS